MKTIITLKHQKIKSPLLIAVIFDVMVIGVSCGKPEIDYREKWVGVYDCEEKWKWWSGPAGQETSGEEIYQIKLSVTTKGDSMLTLSEIRNEDSFEIKIECKGTFYEKIGDSRYITGNFNRDSIYVYLFHGSSPGFGSRSNYKGKKEKNK